MQFAVCGRDSLSLMFRFVIGGEVEMLRYFLHALQRAISRANVAKCVVRPKSLYFWPWPDIYNKDACDRQKLVNVIIV